MKLKSVEDFGLTVVAFLILSFGLLYYAFSLDVLWGWFLTPVFSIAAPGLFPMLGLLFFKMLLFSNVDIEQIKNPNKKDYERGLTLLYFFFGPPSIALTLGWIIVKFTGG